MNSFNKIVIITILLLSSTNVFADNHSTNTELVEKAKEINKKIIGIIKLLLNKKSEVNSLKNEQTSEISIQTREAS